MKKETQEKKSKYSISKRQKYAFDASVQNVLIANDTIKMSQNWLWSLGIAELSFLGVILLRGGVEYVCLIKTIIILILVAFVIFIIGSALQFQHVLRKARFYENISNKAYSYLKKGIDEVEKIPDELNLPEKQIVTNKLVNRLFVTSYILVVVATMGIIFFILIK
ncbi:MAG TPA: hypothetical protein ENI76_04995 [Ignavibacteria bacterium]|nr:hypothetical protein [Ignavibacteria bacterium]